MKRSVAVVGAGISGLTVAQLLKAGYDVSVFEKESAAGGLVRCEKTQRGLFHTCGGHVFNTKNEAVRKWFWTFFDRDADFLKAERNAAIYLETRFIPYPIENYIYRLDRETQKAVVSDLKEMLRTEGAAVSNFEEFLIQRFGRTLYELYFKPYNKKIWQRSLKDVPLGWLEGKLPMPTPDEILLNNFNHLKETSFVHSSFWYEKKNGSQLLVNKLTGGVNIHYQTDVEEIRRTEKGWAVNGREFDSVVFCGNIKALPSLLKGIDLGGFGAQLEAFEAHGTTAVFCRIDANPYSWIYLPDEACRAHRIICTGNFSPTNNYVAGELTGTVEFTGPIAKAEILSELSKLPLHPEYVTHKYNPYTYPIQKRGTRDVVAALKHRLAPQGFYFTGRFADWEYYNMDVAMGAAMQLCREHFRPKSTVAANTSR